MKTIPFISVRNVNTICIYVFFKERKNEENKNKSMTYFFFYQNQNNLLFMYIL